MQEIGICSPGQLSRQGVESLENRQQIRFRLSGGHGLDGAFQFVERLQDRLFCISYHLDKCSISSGNRAAMLVMKDSRPTNLPWRYQAVTNLDSPVVSSNKSEAITNRPKACDGSGSRIRGTPW